MKNIAIIGTGLAAMSSVETLRKSKNIKISVFESGGLNKINSKQKYKNNFKNSFKYNSIKFKSSKKKFLNNYKIKEKNFFLANVNCFGGLSNFWGGGVEIPEKKFLIENNYPKEILNYYPNIMKIFKIDKKLNKKFYTIRKTSLYKKIDDLNEKNFKINNIDISLVGKKTLNTKSFFQNSAKNKHIKLYLNHHVDKIKKENNSYSIFIKNKKKQYIFCKKFDVIILCAGTIASTILILKYLNLKNKKIRFYNNPMMQLCFYGPNLYFQKNNKINFSHPLKNFYFKNGSFESKGSLIPLKYFENYHLGYSKKNILINFLKRGIIAGNIFFDSKLTNNFISLKQNKTVINFKNRINQNNILRNTKNKILKAFKKINFFSVPLMNFKLYSAGSDAHYTSSLFKLKINKKNLIKKNCELEGSRNFFILDGSVIPRGTFYPSFLIALNAFYYSKKIIEKK